MISYVARIQSVANRWLGSDAKSLRSRVIRGGGLLLLGDAYSHVVRLSASLVMTRLLFPEAFGLMLIVNLLLVGLDMFSDLGIRGAIIVKKGELQQHYIHTAWTMGVARGFILGLMAILLAHPISEFYQQDQLFAIILIASMAPMIKGLTSPYPMLQEKGVRLGKVVVWQCATQTLAVIILLGWLLVHPTIWALAANGVIAAAIGAIGSYYLFPSGRMKLAWHRGSAWEIFSIGRWLFIASGLTFLARQGDSLIISKWITADQLGVFSIAVTFSKLVEMLVERISWSLLFPAYAEIQSGDNERFNAQLRKVKLVLYGICGPIVLVFALFGRDIIGLLYDPRYHDAGWMLEIMAAGSVFFAAGAAIINIPMSFGDSYRHMWLQLFRFIVLLGVMTVGGMLGGIGGLIIGIAVAQMLFYPILRLVTHKYGIRDYQTDMVFLMAVMSIIGIAWYIRGSPL